MTPLADRRSVDDQAEWLDDSHVLYGLPRGGGAQDQIEDVWPVPISDGGKPKVLIPEASSRAVIR